MVASIVGGDRDSTMPILPDLLVGGCRHRWIADGGSISGCRSTLVATHLLVVASVTDSDNLVDLHRGNRSVLRAWIKEKPQTHVGQVPIMYQKW